MPAPARPRSRPRPAAARAAPRAGEPRPQSETTASRNPTPTHSGVRLPGYSGKGTPVRAGRPPPRFWRSFTGILGTRTPVSGGRARARAVPRREPLADDGPAFLEVAVGQGLEAGVDPERGFHAGQVEDLGAGVDPDVGGDPGAVGDGEVGG